MRASARRRLRSFSATTSGPIASSVVAALERLAAGTASRTSARDAAPSFPICFSTCFVAIFARAAARACSLRLLPLFATTSVSGSPRALPSGVRVKRSYGDGMKYGATIAPPAPSAATIIVARSEP